MIDISDIIDTAISIKIYSEFDKGDYDYFMQMTRDLNYTVVGNSVWNSVRNSIYDNTVIKWRDI